MIPSMWEGVQITRVKRQRRRNINGIEELTDHYITPSRCIRRYAPRIHYIAELKPHKNYNEKTGNIYRCIKHSTKYPHQYQYHRDETFLFF